MVSIEQLINKEATIEEIILKDVYVPFMEKCAIASTGMKSNYDAEQNIYVQTPLMYLYFTMSAIKLYTSLDIDMAKAVEQYDLLQKHGIINDLVKELNNVADFHEYRATFDMAQGDFIKNEASTSALLMHLLNGINHVQMDKIMEAVLKTNE